MDVKWQAADRKRSTPADFIKNKEKKQQQLGQLNPTASHQNNHSVGNARSSNNSMAKHQESSMFQSQMMSGNPSGQLSVSQIR